MVQSSCCSGNTILITPLAHNSPVYPISPLLVIAALLALVPYLAAAFFPARLGDSVRMLPKLVQVILPSLLCVPYVLVTVDRGGFSTHWLALYALLPVGMAALMTASQSFWRGKLATS